MRRQRSSAWRASESTGPALWSARASSAWASGSVTSGAARGPQRLGRDALGVERRVDTVEHERDHLGDDVVGGRRMSDPWRACNARSWRRERRAGRARAAGERDRDDAGSRSTQPVRVARAGRLLAEPERGRDAVELVGERDERPGKAAGGRGTGGVRQVLLADRLGDRLGQPGAPCIDGADVALELGELADEPRGLVRLGEPRRHAGRARASAHRSRSRPRAGDERLDPRRLVGERAGAGVEADAAEAAREALRARPRGPSRARTPRRRDGRGRPARCP